MLEQNLTESNENYSYWFVIVTAIFITCLITANIIAVKLVSIFGLVVPAAVVVFPISYIVGDILTEVYGYHRARQVIWLGFICNLIAVLAIWIGKILPSAAFWEGQQAYDTILGGGPRLLAASFVAYIAGNFANSYILAKMKIATQGRWLWTRTIGSTLVGEGLDSLIFITFAFVGTIPLSGLVSAIVTQWIFKSVYEALVTPVTYKVVDSLKHQEGMDVYDYDTQFNPLLVTK